jgi:hypothetical protein
MIHSLLLRWGCQGASEGEFRNVAPEVPCGATTTGLWDVLTVADSFLTGDGVGHDVGDLGLLRRGDEWL